MPSPRCDANSRPESGLVVTTLHGGTVSPRCQPCGHDRPKELDGGLHGVQDATGLGEFVAGMGRKAGFGRTWLSVSKWPASRPPTSTAVSGWPVFEIDRMIVAAQSLPRRSWRVLAGPGTREPARGPRFPPVRRICSNTAARESCGHRSWQEWYFARNSRFSPATSPTPGRRPASGSPRLR